MRLRNKPGGIFFGSLLVPHADAAIQKRLQVVPDAE
jgi:hypothetical protein